MLVGSIIWTTIALASRFCWETALEYMSRVVLELACRKSSCATLISTPIARRFVAREYPLAQAVEDRIVKAPLIVTKEDDPKQPKEDPDHITRENVAEKYGYWVRAAVQRWKEHWSVYKKLNTKPVLFIMAEKNV